jgi:hypothetical protein
MLQLSSLLKKTRRPSRLVLLLPSLALLLCFCGCKNVINSLGELGQLRSDLIKEFHEADITVALNNSTVLTVSFINSPLNEAPTEARFKRAQETAVFIKRRYAGINGVEHMLIRFMQHETRMFVDYTQEIDGFVFGKNAVLIGAPPGGNPDEYFKTDEDVTVSYNATSNESEIRIARMQLEGDMDKGVALSPHFKVRGDATTAGHALGIPGSVVFNFSSFAPAKIFKNDPPLKIVADGGTVFSDKAHNLSSAAEGGNEFLVQAIPLDQFLKLAAARTVVLGLGPKEYLLSAKHLKSLREMADYANSGRAK